MKNFLSVLAIIVTISMLAGTVAFANTSDTLLISDNSEEINVVEFDKIQSDATIDSDAEVTSDAEAGSDAEVTSDADITSDAEITSDANDEAVSDTDSETDVSSGTTGSVTTTPDNDKEVPSTGEDAPQPDETVTFSDLSADDWAYDAIVTLAKKGIINGDETGAINPDGGVTREEVAKMMVISRGYEVKSDATLDVNDPESVADWAKGYMATAIEKGIISGYEDGTVKGNVVVNRAEMATIIVRSLNASIDNFEKTSFADITTDDWYAKYVECAKTLGVVNGYEDGTFKGEASVTRREAFAMIQRLVRLLEALEA